MSPSSLLQRLARREPGALEQLIEVTHEEALRRAGGDLERLLATFQTMLDHLREVGPRTDFWTWFARIAGEARPGNTGSSSPDQARLALQQALILPDKARTTDSWREVLGRSMLNGWLPGYGVLLGVALGGLVEKGSFPPTDEWVSMFLGLQFLATLGAYILAAFLGPWLGPWRRALGGRGFLVASLLLSVVQMLCFLALVPGLFLYLDYLSGEGARLPRLLNHLDEWVTDLTPAVISGAILGGLLAGLLGRPLAAGAPWLTYKGDSGWRKLLGACLLLPIVGICAAITPVLRDGRSVNPEILALEARWRAGEESARTWSEQLQSRAGQREAEIPSKALLAELRKEWKGHFWEDPRTRSVAGLFRSVRPAPSSADEVELMVRVMTVRPEVIPLPLLTQSVSEVAPDSGQLATWIDIVLARADLSRPSCLDAGLWGSYLPRALRDIAAQEQAGQRFRALGARQRLNAAWSHGLADPPNAISGLFLEEGKKHRRALVEALLYLEMERCRRPTAVYPEAIYPERVEDLRPEVARLMKLYGIQVELCEDRHCWVMRSQPRRSPEPSSR